MLNLTQGLRDANKESLDDPIPKCHRQYRVFTGFTADSSVIQVGQIDVAEQ